ncbi:hypothetical protein WS70_26690 [Burkholderia mayonis]|uniref:Uncharacterized protein n=1 Tax=Burkholderia mayonis TaxID=1385591 RepID=A0A1B4FNN9_9BURK|nr:hypothetical protein WS70_26690 [Burkholderia mayonis]KVE40703.1 hypothetical protein WS70_16620 [Burkholderia mayonis]
MRVVADRLPAKRQHKSGACPRRTTDDDATVTLSHGARTARRMRTFAQTTATRNVGDRSARPPRAIDWQYASRPVRHRARLGTARLRRRLALPHHACGSTRSTSLPR